MKKILLLITFIVGAGVFVKAQLPGNFNLVSNGGFEFLTNDFIDTQNSYNSNCWFTVDKFSLIVCNNKKPFGFKVPIQAHSGNITVSLFEWVGEYSYYANFQWTDTSSINNTRIRRYIGTKLKEPLIAGKEYFFTLYAAASKDSEKKPPSTDHLVFANIGVYFSKNRLKADSMRGRINVVPQINFSEWDIPYNNQLTFVKLRGTYRAIGGEEFITIGNFDFYANYTLIHADKPGFSGSLQAVYPLIDDISLVSDTSIQMISPDNFSVGNDTFLCKNNSVRLQATPYFDSYKWNTGDTGRTIEVTKLGLYWCEAGFECGFVRDTIVVSEAPAPAPFNIADTALCEAKLPVSISAPYTTADYLWSNGSTGFTANINSIGKHWLRMSNACGDKFFTDTLYIRSLNVALSNINLGNDTSNCFHSFYLDTITLKVPASAATQIKWSTGSNENIIRVNEPGAYWVQVSNTCFTVADTINITGCVARDVPKVDIPNAFSPNGDGKNDVFRLKYLPQQVLSFNLKIYNRYGQMVSELKSRNEEWDGGNYELGVYYYLFVYKDINGKEYTQKGDISLVR